MKKLLFAVVLLTSIYSYGQSTTMLAMLLEDGKEESYLKMEENWKKVNEAFVANGSITQWSVWKRTPREGDENWAQYYVLIRRNAKQDQLQNDNWKEVAYKAFKGKSKKTVDKMLSSEGIIKEIRSRTYKVVASTGY